MKYIFYYKIICLLVGLIIVFLGHVLFLKGVFSSAGDMDVAIRDTKLILRKAAPGTYFVVFGSIIISMVIFKGYTTQETQYTPFENTFNITAQDSSTFRNENK